MEQIKHCVYKDGEVIKHRPPFKVWINNTLRILQFWTKNKFVIASRFDTVHKGGKLIKETLMGYDLKKIKHTRYLL